MASCPDHDPPFAWMADLYFGRENRVAVLANRGGGKTLGSACLHFATGSTKPRYRISHFGGTMRQASECQGYVREIAGRPGVGAVLQGEPRTTWVRWNNGAFLSIHTATEKQASGGHPLRKQADEFDLWDYLVWQKFLGMGATSDDPEAADIQTVYTSTRSRKYGLMHNLVSSAHERGIRVYRYCIWDVKAPCVDCEQSKCELWDVCQGKHKDSSGHIPRNVVIDKALQMDTQTAKTELFCEEPSELGICWPNFDPIAREGSNVTPRAEYRPDWPVFWASDDNYAEPRCTLLCQVDETTGFTHVFDEYYKAQKLAEETVAELLEDKERYPYQAPEYCIPDPTAKSLHGAMHRANIGTFPPLKYRRTEGVKVVRRWIRDARGVRMLLIHPRCKNLIRSMEVHHFKELPPGPDGKSKFSDDPEKHSDDHGADTISYLCWVRRHTA